MKPRALWTLLAVAVLVGGCSPGPAEREEAAPSSSSRLGVVEVSNYPLAYFVERIAGPAVDVSFRMGGAGDPALWRPSPEDVTAMQAADLILLNGASYEQWLDEVSLPSSRIVDTTAGQGERLIPVIVGVTHSHGLEGEHEHTGTAFTTWLDPTLAAEQATAVAAALGKRWPDQAAGFESRLAELRADLESLDEELRAATAGAADQPVVFSHPVYQYLEKRYGLPGHSVHWEPDAALDEKMWADLKHDLDHRPARWMIWEGEPLPEVVARLKELGLASAVFDPCGNRPDEGDFLQTMRRNAEALRDVYRASDPS